MDLIFNGITPLQKYGLDDNHTNIILLNYVIGVTVVS